MRRVLLLCWCVLVGGCAADAASPVPRRQPPREEAAIAPFRARWKVISDKGGQLRISAVVERRSLLHAPIEVTIEIPAGLQLTSGQASFRVPAEMEPGETEVPLEFTYAAVPTGDLRVVATFRSEGMGVRAVDIYRFGRPAPEPNRPRPIGPDVKVGDTDLGRAIPLDASDVQ